MKIVGLLLLVVAALSLVGACGFGWASLQARRRASTFVESKKRTGMAKMMVTLVDRQAKYHGLVALALAVVSLLNLVGGVLLLRKAAFSNPDR